MWVFVRNSFLSVVEDEKDSRVLVVRSRIRGDIERLFPGARVDEDTTASRDYRYRAWLWRSAVVKVIAQEVDQIDYPNFKNALIEHEGRGWSYFRVWESMSQLQRQALEAERGKGK
jgi:hypothetical protein